ncbi:TPA: hypothetical protein DDZ86_00775 [Candidatus Dependentiae bacterium]|nr:MAG: Triosephosphate isomerase [candidate division TM6 bacterium GW2011_GWF2_43_87]HBL98158.1 hypothetical protein [Candidatus Dependentiae bacterium]
MSLMSKKFLYVANWKSYISFSDAVLWCDRFGNQLETLVSKGDIVICPDFLSIESARKKLPHSVAIGAQDCSGYNKGAFTGGVSAVSLKEVGVRYCIVGHSERRQYWGESVKNTAEKARALCEMNITPIVCVGEGFKKELSSFFDEAGPSVTSFKSLVVAYEPEGAIGTGVIPSEQSIDSVCKKIHAMLLANGRASTRVLYGGSVNSKIVANLKKVATLDGFLIGRASTDFQELEKIVVLG